VSDVIELSSELIREESAQTGKETRPAEIHREVDRTKEITAEEARKKEHVREQR